MRFDKDLIPHLVLLLMILAALYLYPTVPLNEDGLMAVHWGPDGQADGYGSRFVGVWLIPIITVVIYGFFMLIPRIAVYRENIKKFYKYYYGLKLILVLFMAAIYTGSIMFNFGYKFNFNLFMVPGLCILYLYIGYMMPKLKRNFFVGIKTPWTLASDHVWKKTHELGGKLFIGYAIIILLGLLYEQYVIWLILIPLCFLLAIVLIYSYSVYKKENKK